GGPPTQRQPVHSEPVGGATSRRTRPTPCQKSFAPGGRPPTKSSRCNPTLWEARPRGEPGSRCRLEQAHALYFIAFIKLLTQQFFLLPRLGNGAFLHRAVATNHFRQRGDGHGGAVVGGPEASQQLVHVLIVVGEQRAILLSVLAIAERIQAH